MHTYTHIHTCIHAYIHKYTTHTHKHTHTHIYIHTYACIHTHTHTHTHTYIHTYTHTHTHIHTHIHRHVGDASAGPLVLPALFFNFSFYTHIYIGTWATLLRDLSSALFFIFPFYTYIYRHVGDASAGPLVLPVLRAVRMDEAQNSRQKRPNKCQKRPSIQAKEA